MSRGVVIPKQKPLTIRYDKYILDADGRPLFERVHEANCHRPRSIELASPSPTTLEDRIANERAAQTRNTRVPWAQIRHLLFDMNVCTTDHGTLSNTAPRMRIIPKPP